MDFDDMRCFGLEVPKMWKMRAVRYTHLGLYKFCMNDSFINRGCGHNLGNRGYRNDYNKNRGWNPRGNTTIKSKCSQFHTSFDWKILHNVLMCIGLYTAYFLFETIERNSRS